MFSVILNWPDSGLPRMETLGGTENGNYHELFSFFVATKCFFNKNLFQIHIYWLLVNISSVNRINDVLTKESIFVKMFIMESVEQYSDKNNDYWHLYWIILDI